MLRGGPTIFVSSSSELDTLAIPVPSQVVASRTVFDYISNHETRSVAQESGLYFNGRRRRGRLTLEQPKTRSRPSSDLFDFWSSLAARCVQTVALSAACT
ncbi:hypothetical protein HGRIS_003955 [Hohenbuehelia grisea]|uniref:Uncharacterized protein n=1 Tax=Hohenbuehelia grisea TaxID=104357 RepID=A0ABR3JH07_9AGAR